MRRKPPPPIENPFSAYLPDAEVERLLGEVGKLFKSRMKGRITVDRLAYATNLSRSQVENYRKGKDMFLSSFLKMAYGLDIGFGDVFTAISKTKKHSK